MRKNLIFKVVPWLILIIFLFAYKQQIPLVQELQLSTFDGYQKTFPREPVDLPVYVIDIDEKSLKEIGQWPWPRNVLADLVNKSFDLGLKSLGFDMVFPERDGKSPEVVSSFWPDSNVAHLLKDLPSHDALFAKSLGENLVVKGIVASFNNPLGAKSTSKLISNAPIINKHDFSKYIFPSIIVAHNIPLLENSSPYMGHFSYDFESDSTVRHIPLLINADDNIFPALSVEVLRLYGGAKPYKVTHDDFGLKTITVEPFSPVPVSANGKYRIYYREYSGDRYISAVDVLKGRDSAKVLDGAIALVGTSAAGMLDLRSTTIDPVVPGVESHIQTIENIMLGTFIQRTQNAVDIELYALAILGSLMIIFIQMMGAFGAMSFFITIIITVIALCFYQFKVNGLLYDWSYATLTLFVLFLVQSLAKYAEEKASRVAIGAAFSHYLSPDLVKIISKDPSKLVLGGEEKEISVLFSDIRGFTSMSEKLTPVQLTRILNRYLTPMTDIVQNSQGTIDKYMGDAVMAFWNAPLDVEGHARKACAAGLEMLSSLDELNVSLKDEGLPEISIGIGVNTAMMNVGNMGSKQRFDYTVMGDGVNLGARLEGQCKTYGVPLIISEHTLEQLGEVSAMPLDKVAVKGKNKGIKIYHLISLDKPSGENQKKINAVSEAINAYQEQKWGIASELLKNDLVPTVLREIYIKRIKSLKNEISKDWDGVYRATTK